MAYEKYDQLHNWDAVAKYFSTSRRTLERIRQNDKTQCDKTNTTDTTNTTKRQMRQNHDIYIDIEKDIDIETEKELPQEGVSKPYQNSVSELYQKGIKYQNQEEKEKEKEEEKKEKEQPAAGYFLSPEQIPYLENRFCSDGADNEQSHYWLPSDERAALSELARLGFTKEEARYVVREIMGKFDTFLTG